jgi:hypothetical protein
MTLNMGNAAQNLVSPCMFPARHSVTFASVENTMHINPGVTVENLAAACRFITQTHKMSFTHTLALLEI